MRVPWMQSSSTRHAPSRPSRRFVFTALAGALVLAAAGCASVPPPRGTISQAELTIEQAQQAGAQEYAPLDLYQAREKLQDAKAAVDRKENERATRVAELALADAQLAEAKARTEKAKLTEADVRESLDTLRAETATRASQSGR